MSSRSMRRLIKENKKEEKEMKKWAKMEKKRIKTLKSSLTSSVESINDVNESRLEEKMDSSNQAPGMSNSLQHPKPTIERNASLRLSEIENEFAS